MIFITISYKNKYAVKINTERMAFARNTEVFNISEQESKNKNKFNSSGLIVIKSALSLLINELYSLSQSYIKRTMDKVIEKTWFK